MASLNIPNDIVDAALVEAIDHQQNYQEIETHVNANLVNKDGSVGMAGPLLLNATATAPLEAVGLAQMEAADTAAVATASADATAKADAAEAAAVVTANAYTDTRGVETDFATDVAAGNLETTSTATLFLDTGNITNTKAGHYIITVTLDVAVHTVAAGPALNAFIGELHVKDVLQLNQMVWHPLPATVGTRATLSQTWIVAAGAGNTLDFQVKVLQAAGGQGSYMCDGSTHSFISALFVG